MNMTKAREVAELLATLDMLDFAIKKTEDELTNRGIEDVIP